MRAAQPLIRLNGIRTGAQLAPAQERRDSLRTLKARLNPERDVLVFPPDLTTRQGKAAVAQGLAGQRRVFAQRAAVLDAGRRTSDQ